MNQKDYKSASAFESLAQEESKTNDSNRPTAVNVTASEPSAPPYTSSDGSDALFLDAEMYSKSRDMINVDGSLNLPETTSSDDATTAQSIDGLPPPPKTAMSYEDLQRQPPPPGVQKSRKSELEEVWSAYQNAKSQPTNTSRSEDLHRQVFEQEQAFLEQSELFQQSLLDQNKANEAALKRRSSQFQQRQEQAMRRGSVRRMTQNFV